MNFSVVVFGEKGNKVVIFIVGMVLGIKWFCYFLNELLILFIIICMFCSKMIIYIENCRFRLII